MDDREIPFTRGHVLRATHKKMRVAIDISIRKTFSRRLEFTGDTEKSTEIFETLALLHTMRQNLDEFQKINQEYFKG